MKHLKLYENFQTSYEIIDYSLNVNRRELKSLDDVIKKISLDEYNKLRILECGMNYIQNLPQLPVGLVILGCGTNELEALPELPKTLESLHCGYNNLNRLPELPETLKFITCGTNQLTSLPELPKKLKKLNCAYNKLTSLPELPNGLVDVYCTFNNIKYLPKLPKSINYFVCDNNPLECLIPSLYLNQQSNKWMDNYYIPYINSYIGQKNILTMNPDQVTELVKQSFKILPEIREEFYYLFTGNDLNLL